MLDQRDRAGLAADVDDLAGLLRHHRRHQGAGHQPGRPQIDRLDEVPFRDGLIHHQLRHADARVVDQDVDRAPGGKGVLGRPLGLCRASEVGADGQAAAAVGLHPRLRLGETRRVPRDRDDIRPRLAQHAAKLGADPLGGAGHQRLLAVKCETLRDAHRPRLRRRSES